MSKLEFNVKANWQELERLNKEIDKHIALLEKIDVNKNPKQAEELVSNINRTRSEMEGLVTTSVKAGTELNEGFKRKIYDSSVAVNDLTEKIIAQRNVVRQNQQQVNGLASEYRNMDKSNPNRTALLNSLNAAKEALNKEKSALASLQSEQASARLSVKRLKDEYEAFREESSQTINVTNSSTAAFTKMFAAIGGVAALKSFASSIVDIRSQMESTEKAYEVLLGSKQKADSMLSDLKEYAIVSPLEFTDLSDATKTMMGFGVETEKVLPIIKQLGDVSMGESAKFQSLTLAFSQVSAAGKLTGGDLLQFVNAGFNPLKEMARTTGREFSVLKDEMSKGAISAEMVAEAFRTATEEGGQFYGMTEKAAQNISSYQSNLANAVTEALSDVGKQNEDLIKISYEGATALVGNYDKIGKVIITLIGTYGTYKAAVIALNVVQSIQTRMMLESALAGRTLTVMQGLLAISTKKLTAIQAALNTAILANPYAIAATAVIGLITATLLLTKNTTEAEEASRRHSEYMRRQKESTDDLKSSIESLLGVIKEETSTETQRYKALSDLQRLYPKIFENQSVENLLLADKHVLLKKINVEIEKEQAADNRKRVQQLRDEIEQLKQQGELLTSGGMYGVTTMKPNESMIKRKEAELFYLQKELSEQDKAESNAYFAGLPNQEQIKILKAELKGLLDLQDKNFFLLSPEEQAAFNDLPKRIKDVQAQILAAETDLNSQAETVGERRNKWAKELVDAEKKLADMKKDSSVATEEEIKKQEELVKKLKDSLGVKKNADKTTKEISDKIISSELALNAERLAVLEEGRHKRLEKNKQEHEEKKAAIEKEYKELKEAYKAAGKTIPVNIKDVYENRIANVGISMSFNEGKINKEYDKEVESKIRALTQVYLTEEGKRLEAIKNRYDKEREWAALQLKGGGFNQDQYNDYVFKIDNAQRHENLQSLLDQYKSWADKRLQIELDYNEQLKTLEESRSDSNSGEIDKAVKNLEDSKKKALSKLSLDELKDGDLWAKMFSDLDKLAIPTLENILEKAKEVDTSAWDPTQVKEYEDAIKRLTDAIESRNPFKAIEGSFNTLMEGIKSGDKDSVAQGLDGISNATDKINSDLKTIAGGIGDVFGEEAGYAAEQVVALTSAIGGFAKGASQIAKGDILGGIASVVSSIGSIFSMGKKVKEMNRQAREENQKFYDEAKKGELEYQMLIRERLRLEQQIGETMLDYNSRITSELEKQKEENSSEYDRLWAELQGENYISGKGYKHGTWFRKAKTWNEYSSLSGKSYDEIEKLYMEGKLEGKGKDIFEQLQKLKEEGADIDKMLVDQAESFKEYISGMTFDSLTNSIKAAFEDGKMDIQETADFTKDAFKKAILQSFEANYLAEKLQPLLNSFQKDAEAGTLLDKWDYYNNWMNDIAEGGNKWWDDIMKLPGISDIFDDSKIQQASNGGLNTMSQETGNELNGRFTALQMAGEEIKAQSILQSAISQVIQKQLDAAVIAAQNTHGVLMDTKTILMNSYMELLDINNNTANTVKRLDTVVQRLDKIQQNTSKL